MQVRKFCSTVSSSTTAAAIGAAAFVVGASLDLSDLAGAIRQIGALILVGVIVKSCIRPAVMPIAEAFKCGHEQGMGQGYTLGHREARPVVVRFPTPQARPEPADSEKNPDAHSA